MAYIKQRLQHNNLGEPGHIGSTLIGVNEVFIPPPVIGIQLPSM
jgi:hypothetical protein